MNIPALDRRKGNRGSCCVEAMYRKKFYPMGAQRSAMVKNISLSGLLMESKVPLYVGEELEIVLQSPLIEGKVPVRGTVKRTVDEKEGRHMHHLAGISLNGVSESESVKRVQVNRWLLYGFIALTILFSILQLYRG